MPDKTKADRPFIKTLGNGPALVLLHSWCGSHQDWAKLVPSLSQHFTLYMWDARGHGRTAQRANGPYSLDQMATDLHELITSLAPEKPIVVGHSMGALTLWQYLATYGESALSKIVILDQSPKLITDESWANGIYGNFDHQANLQFLKDLHTDFAEAVLRLNSYGLNTLTRQKYEQNSPGTQASRTYLQQQNKEALIQIWQSLSLCDFRKLLTEITLPALLVYGEQSNYYTLDTAHFVRDQFQQATFHRYEGADHSPHLKQPERFIKDLLDFCY